MFDPAEFAASSCMLYPHRLASLDDLSRLAAAEGITISS
jgi:hypothetical protein